jgi:hypothetical protein
VPIVASKDVFPPFPLDLFQTRFKRLQILVSKGEKKEKNRQDLRFQTLYIYNQLHISTYIYVTFDPGTNPGNNTSLFLHGFHT